MTSASVHSTNAYSVALDALMANAPTAERERRRLGLQKFLVQGFPTRREEAWRYTDLGALNDRVFAVAGVGEAEVPRGLPRIAGSERLVFVDGRFDEASSDKPNPTGPAKAPGDAADWRLGDLNTALASEGVDLAISRNVRPQEPLHVVVMHRAARSSMIHQRHRLTLGEHAEAEVIFEFLGGGEGLSTQSIEIDLAPGARLRLLRLEHQDAGSTLLTHLALHLDANAQAQIVCVDAGQGLARHDLAVRFAAKGADCELSGLYRPQAGAHIDNHARLIHEAPHGRSRAQFRGIVGEKTRAVLVGKVVVAPGAQKTDSELRIANLLLSRHAEVDAKPDLEIRADDVKCAHGATVGQIDEIALGYLRSRGIDEADARRLLLRGFAVTALDAITSAEVRTHVEHLLGFDDSGAA